MRKNKRITPIGYYLIPNLLTTGSMFFGFVGILWAISGKFYQAAMAILISGVLDGLDGKVARLTKASSDFGIQMDSLADLIAFGAAPAITVFLWKLHYFGRIGVAMSFLFLACGALRLARFNLMAMRKDVYDPRFFKGLPIPAAACFLATLILFSRWASFDSFFSEKAVAIFCLISTFSLALLMVSNAKYYSFKDLSIFKTRPFTSSLIVILLFVLVSSEPYMITFLFVIGYTISGPVYTYVYLPRKRALSSDVVNSKSN